MKPVTTNIMHKRLTELEQILGPHESALVAFSGGVDSSLALAAAARALPKDRVLAVTSNNETYLPSELHLARLAKQKGYACVVDGANKDDEGDYRPGRKAARELGVVSVLSEAGMTKAEVRELAKHLDLPTWDKPALACLSSRFPYGQEITPEKLSQVAHAEEFLRKEGFRQVRVRHHGEIARLEVGPEEMEKAFASRGKISAELKEVGFLYVALDLSGYESGSLNAALPRKGKKSRPTLPVV